MEMAQVETSSPLEQLRDWVPPRAQYVWVVFDDSMYKGKDQPIVAFPTELDAQMFCVDQVLDRDISGTMSIESAEEFWPLQFSVKKVPYYP